LDLKASKYVRKYARYSAEPPKWTSEVWWKSEGEILPMRCKCNEISKEPSSLELNIESKEII
jgi:hypothetical protein